MAVTLSLCALSQVSDGSAHLTMLPRAMRHVLRPSKLTLAFARESKGMWISTSEASGTTSGLQEALL